MSVTRISGFRALAGTIDVLRAFLVSILAGCVAPADCIHPPARAGG
jgi:hypothetical protein